MILLNSMNIYSNPDINYLLDCAKSEINKLFGDNQGKSILFLVSSGSAFNLLPLIDINLISNNVTVGILDERYSNDTRINNFSQFTQTDFYKKVINTVKFIDTQVKINELMKDLAKRFEYSLKKWRHENPKGIVVATQGIGPDGHTAGIFPHQNLSSKLKQQLEDKNIWIVGYDVGKINKYPLRITPNFYFLSDIIDYSYIYVVGKNKESILKSTFKNGSIFEIPARIIHKMKSVYLFTDIII